MFLSAADSLVAEFSGGVVKPDDMRGNPAIGRAVQLMVANDLSALQPSWATSPSIMDDRAWDTWRWPAGLAAQSST
jgi:hypothetical protein